MIQKLFLSLLCYCFFVSDGSAQTTDSTYFVTLLSGKTIYTDDLKLKDPLFKTSYLLVNDKDKYKLDEVKIYQIKEGYYRKFTGDSWYKRQESGKINMYSRIESSTSTGGYSNTGNMGAATYSGPRTRTVTVYYTQMEGKEPQKITYSNLSEQLKSNQESMALLKKGRQSQNIKLGLLVGGAALFVGGAVATLTNKSETASGELKPIGQRISPLIYVSGAAIVASYYIKSPFTKYKEAIKVFNGSK